MTSEKKSFWQRDSWLSEDDKSSNGENNATNGESGVIESFKEQLQNDLGNWVSEGLKSWVNGPQDEQPSFPDPVIEERKPGFFKRSITRIVNVGMLYVEGESKKQGRKS